ncbi:chitin deacetylase [Linnemannia gamsii]|uniref:Chitin deacetylase n=1 Tax=Linnemannia gamsii TaxID=64522 RepID=A0ABQ7K4C8_9FUNG|nr:chitin deacetylase [Linnemannia gamsii]
MTRDNTNNKKKITTVVLFGSIALAITLFSTVADAAAPKIIHKADISHPKGSSPWPNYGEKPKTNTPEVKAWVKSIDWSKVPKLPVRKTESPGDPPECPDKEVPKGDCWWTCSGCYAPDDVVDCPGKKDWGLTFDDGPEPGVTEGLFDLLKEKNVTATFFVTGMKSAQAPWLLKETIDKGHHLASHTWSHSGLTTLTNEEVVAELKWTEKYIFDHTGYKIKYFRPPYGDIDNRVRGIARQLGFKTVIWSNEWDTQDWQLSENTITAKKIVGIFNAGLKSLPERKHGVITLQHDGDKKLVTMARTLLDMGMKKGLRPMQIAQCLGDNVGYNAVPVLPVAAAAPKKHIAPAPIAAVPAADIKEAGGVEPQVSIPSLPASNDDMKEKVTIPLSVNEAANPEKKSSASTVSAGLSVAGWTFAAVVVSYVL